MFAILLLAALPIHQIQLGGKSLTVEIADTAESQKRGLKHRKTLLENSGMLFLFDTTRYLSFWMPDTLLPLSLAFFDEHQTLVEMFEMSVPLQGQDPIPVYHSTQPCRYALEMKKNWFKENGISPGMKFSFLDRANPVK